MKKANWILVTTCTETVI